MQIGSKVIVLEDVHSCGKGRPLYVAKHEQVTIIAIHDNVLIVANKTGNKFSIHKKLVR